MPSFLLMLGIFAVSGLFCVFLIRRAGRSQNPSGPGSSQLQLTVVIIAAVVLIAAAMLVVYLRSGEEDPGQPPRPRQTSLSKQSFLNCQLTDWICTPSQDPTDLQR